MLVAIVVRVIVRDINMVFLIAVIVWAVLWHRWWS